MSTLTIKKLEVYGPDSDGDFEFRIEGYEETPNVYLNRDQANLLIEYLKAKN